MTTVAERYGTKSAPPWRRWVATVAAVAIGLVVAYVLYRQYGSGPIDAERTSFAEKPGNAMSVTITVTRDDPSKPAVCIVRVRDKSGAESGRKEVYVPPGGQSRQLTTTVRSIGRPVTADVFGCGFDVPPYLRPTG